MKEKFINVKDYVVKSKLPASDYVINPYVGCPHACKYCYASFMKRFTGHDEEWGKFIDIKICDKAISKKILNGKTVFLSSVTDCYNPFEKKYFVTQNILKQLVDIDCKIIICTKSDLILRDIEILKRLKNLTVAVSINTLDENFKKDMDKASNIFNRLKTLQALYKNNIKTVLFMSPIFPEITDFRLIIDRTRYFVNEYWFENLNLRGSYKLPILKYIKNYYPQHFDLYQQIYIHKNFDFWDKLISEIKNYCERNSIDYVNCFHHDKFMKNKNTNLE